MFSQTQKKNFHLISCDAITPKRIYNALIAFACHRMNFMSKSLNYFSCLICLNLPCTVFMYVSFHYSPDSTLRKLLCVRLFAFNKSIQHFVIILFSIQNAALLNVRCLCVIQWTCVCLWLQCHRRIAVTEPNSIELRCLCVAAFAFNESIVHTFASCYDTATQHTTHFSCS